MAKWNREVTLEDEEAGEMPFALTSEGGEDGQGTHSPGGTTCV